MNRKFFGRAVLVVCAIALVLLAKQWLEARREHGSRTREDERLGQSKELPLESQSGAGGKVRFRCSITAPGEAGGRREMQYQIELSGISQTVMDEYRTRLGSTAALSLEVEAARSSGRMDSEKELAMQMSRLDSMKLHNGLERATAASIVLRDSGNFEIWRTTISTLSLVNATAADGRAAFEGTVFFCPEGLQKVARATLQ